MDVEADIKTLFGTFRKISKSVHTSKSVNEMLYLAVRTTAEALHAKGALLRILNLKSDEFELSASYGLSEKYLSKGHVARKKLYIETCDHHGPIIIRDVPRDTRVQYPREAQEEGIRMMMDLPLILANDVVGLVRIFFAEARDFSEEELEFAEAIAEECSYAIDKARLIERQRIEYQHLASKTEKLSSLGRLAAGIAHEINNPLGGILLYGTNLIKKIPKEGPLHEGLEVIINETMRCKHIIQDLLEFSRDRPPSKAMANINDIIEKTLSILENEFRLKHVDVKKDLLKEMPDIFLDASQLGQVFVNLLINAIEAIQVSGAVIIRSRVGPDRERVRVEIADTGCGIAPEHMAKIFEPFFSTKPKGTGLGLAVSYGIIQNHQGTIWATSQPGQGTCFTLELPILHKTEAQKAKGN
jgi:two-component system, NtrC family, sensor kinase